MLRQKTPDKPSATVVSLWPYRRRQSDKAVKLNLNFIAKVKKIQIIEAPGIGSFTNKFVEVIHKLPHAWKIG